MTSFQHKLNLVKLFTKEAGVKNNQNMFTWFMDDPKEPWQRRNNNFEALKID